MTIRRRLPPPKEIKFPPAHLYLDDLEEIISILRPDGDDSAPVLQFTVDYQSCDSVDELRKIGEQRIGGLANRFGMSVQWKKDYIRDSLEIEPDSRADFSIGGSARRKVWVMNQIHSVFARRVYLRWRFRWLAALVGVVAYLVGFRLLFRSLDQVTSFKENTRYFFHVDLVVGSFLGYAWYWLSMRFVRSRVTLKSYQPEEDWFKRNRDSILLAAITALVTTPIAVLITILVQKWFSPK